MQWICWSKGDEDNGGNGSFGSEEIEYDSDNFDDENDGVPPLRTADAAGFQTDSDSVEEDGESVDDSIDYGVEPESVSVVQDTVEDAENRQYFDGGLRNDEVVGNVLILNIGNENSRNGGCGEGQEVEAVSGNWQACV